MSEAVPEDRLGLFAREGVEFVAHAGGDEVDLVVHEPVFEAVLLLVLDDATARDALEALAHGGVPRNAPPAEAGLAN